MTTRTKKQKDGLVGVDLEKIPEDAETQMTKEGEELTIRATVQQSDKNMGILAPRLSIRPDWGDLGVAEVRRKAAFGISNPAIKRVATFAGASNISKDVYSPIRDDAVSLMEDIITKAALLMIKDGSDILKVGHFAAAVELSGGDPVTLTWSTLPSMGDRITFVSMEAAKRLISSVVEGMDLLQPPYSLKKVSVKKDTKFLVRHLLEERMRVVIERALLLCGERKTVYQRDIQRAIDTLPSYVPRGVGDLE